MIMLMKGCLNNFILFVIAPIYFKDFSVLNTDLQPVILLGQVGRIGVQQNARTNLNKSLQE
jgi:hypothetical protein